MKHYNLRIFGYVQGVNFRFEAKKIAEKFGVRGFAQNSREQSVYVEAEGEDEPLKKFLAWCEIGPVGGEVDRVEIEEGVVKGYDKFEVKY